ncbi:hypothetical protein ACRB9V_23550 [Salmonella enterica subsp. enterica serovar Paratyphi A]
MELLFIQGEHLEENIHNNYSSLYCANIYAKQSPSTESKPVNFIAQIENIDFNKTAISSDLKLLLADRYYFKDKTPCNTNTLSARAEYNGTDDRRIY